MKPELALEQIAKTKVQTRNKTNAKQGRKVKKGEKDNIKEI